MWKTTCLNQKNYCYVSCGPQSQNELLEHSSCCISFCHHPSPPPPPPSPKIDHIWTINKSNTIYLPQKILTLKRTCVIWCMYIKNTCILNFMHFKNKSIADGALNHSVVNMLQYGLPHGGIFSGIRFCQNKVEISGTFSPVITWSFIVS